MYKSRNSRTACWLAIQGAFATTAALSLPAFAQTADGTARVEITGSSIKRIDGETALPVQVLNRADIARTGASTAEQLLKMVSATAALGSTSVANTGPGGGQGGYSGSVTLVSLRGLGSARTLVLINGRRSAPAAGSPSVDISTIPVAAIERVEILKDGASAVYGSDAIAGVVNFILRKDFKGTEISATLGSPTRSGGGQEAKISLFSGFGDFDTDRYSVTFSAGYQHIKPIFGSSRDFDSNLNVGQRLDRTSSTSFPANVILPNGKLASPNYPNCAPYSIVSPFSSVCRYDNNPYNSVQPDSKQANLLLNARFNFSASTEGYVESTYTRNETVNTNQHVLINGGAAPADYAATINGLIASYIAANPANTYLNNYKNQAYALLPPGSPYYPTAFATANGLDPNTQPLVLQFRSIPTGVRKTQDVSDDVRLVAGVRGTALGWDYDSAVLYSQDKIATSLVQGWTNTNAYLSLIDSGVINPFGATADASAAAAAFATNYDGLWNTTKESIASVDVKASRDLYKLSAGMISLALGAEFRKEKLDIAPVAANQQFEVSGFGAPGVPIAADRNVTSGYAELNIPVLKTLEADLAVRYDKYQRVGSTSNPKASLRWQPLEQFLVRGSAGSGFRAPTLVDLYSPQANGITTNGQRDLVRCPVGTTGLVDCSTQFVTVGGGNPALKPEKSESYTLGFLAEPTKDYSIGLDFFHVTVKDVIRTGLSVATILGNPVLYANQITRGAPDGNPSGVGPILGINQAQTNLGKVIVGGVDVDLKARVLNTGGNRVTLRMNGTYMAKYDQQNLNGSFTSAINQPNGYGSIGVVLRWRDTASATWETGDWASTFAWNYQNPYHDTLTPLSAAGTVPREVASYSTLDAQVSYAGFKKTRLTLGVKNLADTNPPYTNYSGGFVGSYDLSYTDVRGRFVYLAATYSF